MTKLQYPRIVSGINGWDAEFDDVIDILEGEPIPLVEYTSVGALPTASLNDRSIAFADTDGGGGGPWFLHYSDGSSWHLIARGDGAAQIDVADAGDGTPTVDTMINVTAPGDTPASVDALRDDLEANALQDIRDNFATISAEFNNLLAVLRTERVLTP